MSKYLVTWYNLNSRELVRKLRLKLDEWIKHNNARIVSSEANQLVFEVEFASYQELYDAMDSLNPAKMVPGAYRCGFKIDSL